MKQIFQYVVILSALLWAMTNSSWSIDVSSSREVAITITSPSNAVEFADGDEFATDVIGKPWDMTQMYDLAYRARYYEPLTPVSNGIWTGTYFSPTAFYWPLFRGVVSTPGYLQYFSYYDAGTPYGPLNPIDASKYNRLSIRHSLDSQNRSFLYINWFKTYIDSETNYIGFIDADATPNCFVPYNSGFRIYDIDLTGCTYTNERVTGIYGPLDQGGTWDGTIYGFYIVPSLAGAAGTVYSVDWIRLYHSAASPILPVTWTTTAVPVDDDSYTVQLFLDTDSSGYDGDLFLSGIRNDGRFDLSTAALPPGDYYVYLRLVHTETTSFTTVATSEYSPRIRIGVPPTFTFTAPTMTSGVDYATTDLGNPWDMNSADDLDLSRMHDISSYSFSDGMFVAVASSAGDSQLWLNTQCNGRSVPIYATQYRYFTFRMYYDTSQYNNYTNMEQRAWDMGNVARLQWAKSDFAIDGSYSKDIILLEGWHSYSVDLWDNALLETRGDYSTAQAGWTNIQQVNYIGIHPLENSVPLTFKISDVKLCAMNAPVNHSYTISWNATDPDSDSLTVTLYYGYFDSLGAYHEVSDPIAAVTNAHIVHSYVWDTSHVSAGEYYIRAVVSDGVQQRSRLALVPVIILGALTSVPGDYDSDGKTDHAKYEQCSGVWSVQLSSDDSRHSLTFGGTGYTPLAADFDGDGKADPAIYEEVTGTWSVKLSAAGYATATAQLGGSGYTPLAADFDGDGKADLAVYEEATGNWMVMLSAAGYAAATAQLGGASYSPVSGDFDGDSKADPTVFQDTTGYWTMMLSGSNYAVVLVE